MWAFARHTDGVREFRFRAVAVWRAWAYVPAGEHTERTQLVAGPSVYRAVRHSWFTSCGCPDRGSARSARGASAGHTACHGSSPGGICSAGWDANRTAGVVQPVGCTWPVRCPAGTGADRYVRLRPCG